MHELSRQIINESKIANCSEDINTVDKIITDWLKLKHEEIVKANKGSYLPCLEVERILGLKEKTLVEKFEECMNKHEIPASPEDDRDELDEEWKETLSPKLAQIAREHYDKT